MMACINVCFGLFLLMEIDFGYLYLFSIGGPSNLPNFFEPKYPEPPDMRFSTKWGHCYGLIIVQKYKKTDDPILRKFQKGLIYRPIWTNLGQIWGKTFF